MRMTLAIRSARTFIQKITRDENVSMDEAVHVMEKMLYRSAADCDMTQVLRLVRTEMDGSDLRGTHQE